MCKRLICLFLMASLLILLFGCVSIEERTEQPIAEGQEQVIQEVQEEVVVEEPVKEPMK